MNQDNVVGETIDELIGHVLQGCEYVYVIDI